jgi:hypothetical protein
MFLLTGLTLGKIIKLYLCSSLDFLGLFLMFTEWTVRSIKEQDISAAVAAEEARFQYERP